MAMTKEKILESISEMSVMDVCELVKMMEEKFGVSAQQMAPNTVSSNETTAGNAAEEQTEFNVILLEAGPNKVASIKAVRSVTSLGLKEARDAVQGVPFTIKESVSKEEAESTKKKLEESGSKVEIK